MVKPSEKVTIHQGITVAVQCRNTQLPSPNHLLWCFFLPSEMTPLTVQTSRSKYYPKEHENEHDIAYR